MSVSLLFPAYVFERQLLGKDKFLNPNIDAEYFNILKNEIDFIRKKDPVGRKLSNTGGWQSKEGLLSNPVFNTAFQSIKDMITTEMMPFLGSRKACVVVYFQNAWANINNHLAWNSPHIHPGSFYSGVMYIDANGNEGDFVALDTNHKIAGTSPYTARIREKWRFTPKTGAILLFPSGLMHMVEPNNTRKNRYSISFNFEVLYNTQDFDRMDMTNPDLYFELDQKGNIKT